MKDNRSNIFLIGSMFSAMLFFLLIIPVRSAVMQSTNYKVDFDSVNSGGKYSTSTNYRFEDTVGEIASGYSTSTSYVMHAGYEQMSASTISITSPADVALSSINGLTGGSGTGSVSWTVTTNNANGYSMTLKASTNPALKAPSGAFFANYTPAGSDPDYSFSIASTDSEFGFSPEGNDISQTYKDNGSACNAVGGGDTADKCWDSITTTDKTFASRGSANAPSGSATVVKLRADSGTSHIQDSGSYSSIITVTATTL